MADTVPKFADLELYPDPVSAVTGLQPAGEQASPHSPLPASALPAGVVVTDGVTLIRPDDAAIRDMDPLTRPGLRYRDLVRHHGHRRLVVDFAGLRPFGHPFHDDIFAILRELGGVGGRLAVCGAKPWYTDRLPMYRRLIRVVVAGRGVSDCSAPDAEPSTATDPAGDTGSGSS